MKKYRCDLCNKDYLSGKFCPECGGPLTEVIELGIKFKKFETAKSYETIKKDIHNWLARLGVQKSDIRMTSNNNTASACVEWTLLGKKYKRDCHAQSSITNNLGAIEQFIHFKVLAIEKGVEELDMTFKGYEALPNYSKEESADPYGELGLSQGVDIEIVRDRFKTIAKENHPDVAKGDKLKENRFYRAKEALDRIEKEKGGTQ